MVLSVKKCDSKCILFAVSHVYWVEREDILILLALQEFFLNFLVVNSPDGFHVWLVLAGEGHNRLAEGH